MAGSANIGGLGIMTSTMFQSIALHGCRVVSVRGRRVRAYIHTPSRAYFKAGAEGKFERGWYNFWVAQGNDRYGSWSVTGRARSNLSPADRFTRIKREMSPRFRYHGKKLNLTRDDIKVYNAIWARLLTVRFIRPASYREVANWLASHQSDAKFATQFYIGGEKFKRLRYV